METKVRAEIATYIIYSIASEHPIKNPGKKPTVQRAKPYEPPAKGNADIISLVQNIKAIYALPTSTVAIKNEPNPAAIPAFQEK